jgi:hypothetical protein
MSGVGFLCSVQLNVENLVIFVDKWVMVVENSWPL